MGMRRNKQTPQTDLNLDHKLGAGLPPLEFKGKRTPPKKGKKRSQKQADAKGRRYR
jgi:hypothetical protein